MVHPSGTDRTGPQIRLALSPSGICYLAAGILGIANLFMGFANVVSGIDSGDGTPVSYYDNRGPWAWLPALLFIGGLVALRAVRAGRDDWLPLVIPLGAVMPFIFATIVSDHPNGLASGEILFMILGPLQVAAAAAGAALRHWNIALVPVRESRQQEDQGPPEADDSAGEL